MLIYIDSFFGDSLLSGKKCSEKELRKRVLETTSQCNTSDFTALFCRQYLFDELPLTEDVEVDFVVDLDTSLVYIPRY